jgi:hypothetical protein
VKEAFYNMLRSLIFESLDDPKQEGRMEIETSIIHLNPTYNVGVREKRPLMSIFEFYQSMQVSKSHLVDVNSTYVHDFFMFVF